VGAVVRVRINVLGHPQAKRKAESGVPYTSPIAIVSRSAEKSRSCRTKFVSARSIAMARLHHAKETASRRLPHREKTRKN